MLKSLYRCLSVSLILGLGLSSCTYEDSDIARIAVATNFLQTAEKLEAAFEAETDYKIDLVSGSTGQFYTQIMSGAPYDVFLSADAARVTRLLSSGHGVEDSQMTYALGQLVLYGHENGEEVLRRGDFQRLAMANPDLAPYGRAAEEVLTHMRLTEIVSDKIVYGQNVGQAYGFVQTGNADIGFVALSHMQTSSDKYWQVPKSYYGTIRQDGILLSKGENNKSAKAFLNYLKTSEAQKMIKISGYEVATP